MAIIFLTIVLVLILVSLLFSIYKTKTYKKPGQLIAAIAGAILLVYLLYTCQADP